MGTARRVHNFSVVRLFGYVKISCILSVVLLFVLSVNTAV